MKAIAKMLGGIEQSYLIRAYLIGCVYAALVMFMVFGSGETTSSTREPWGFVFFAVVNTALFPFAKLVWDQMRNLVLGNNVVWMNAFFLLIAKWIINGMIWTMAIFVAPLGLLYLWFRTRNA